jgi:methylphosphotriester-DNA--protein-cysteine methyltransferase
MSLDAGTCYAALTRRNADFEGVFYVGVRTTGVFCRPTCPARPAKRENCEFFANARQAMLASYRQVQAVSAAAASERDLRDRAPARRRDRTRARQAVARRRLRRAARACFDRAGSSQAVWDDIRRIRPSAPGRRSI